MFVSITYWDFYNDKKGKKPIHKDLHNVTEVYRFYGHYSDNDYLRITYGDGKELFVLWDEITHLTITND